MIIYSKTLWGFPLLTRVYGSALPRSLLPALLSGLITLLLLLLREHMQHLWVHPYPYQPLVLIATFVLTFRSNYAYQRHWEAYTQMQTMTARWLDATVQAIMFDRHPQPPGGKLPSPASHHQFVAELVHLVSLLHATCCAALRRDPDVANLVKHSRLAEAPPTDPAQILNLQRGSLQGGSAPNSPRAGGGGNSASGLGSLGSAAAGRRASADEPRLSRRRSGESSGGAFGSAAAAAAAGSPRVGRRRSAEGSSPFAATAAGNNDAAAAAGDEALPAADGGGSSSLHWTATLSAALPFYRHGEYSIVGAANWRDIFMLRGSPHAVSEYNAAQPLPVVGGVTKQELAALGCKLRQQQEDAASGTGKGLGSVDEDGLDSRQQQQQQYAAAADTAAVRDTGNGGKALWGMLRHRTGAQQQQQQQPGRARSLSFSEGLGSNENNHHSHQHTHHHQQQHHQQQQHQHHQQQQQQPRHSLGSRSTSDNAYGHSSSSAQHHSSSSSSSSNGLGFRPLVQLSGYFDIAALSSRLQSARSFGRSPSAPSLAGMAGAASLSRSPSINLKLNVAPPTPRRIKVSLNHTCCWAHLPYMDRPLLLLSWVHELLLQRQSAGGLRMPAPILARVYTGLSDGLTAYEQCRKLADTPFPFPWAQFVLVMLVLFTVTLPLLVVAYVQNSSMAVVITVMTTSIFWTVNEVARDVEDAFIMEPNNMPLANTQFHFNELLLTLSVAERPASGVVPVVLPMPPGMRLPGSIHAVGTAGDLAAAAAAATDGTGLRVETRRPAGPTAGAAAAAVAAAEHGAVVNGLAAAAAAEAARGPAPPAADPVLTAAAAAAALAASPYGEHAAAADASPRSSRGHSRSHSSHSGSDAGLHHHQQQQHHDQQLELQQQQQQQQQPFQFQALKPLVVTRSGTGSSMNSTGHGTPRCASDPGAQHTAAAAAAGSTAPGPGHGVSTGGVSSAAAGAADGQYSLIPGQYNVGQQQYNAGRQQYNSWEDDVNSSTARDSCSMAADAAELEMTGTAAARAVLVASAASNIQSMEAFAGGGASPAAAGGASPVAAEAAAAGHGVSGWEMQPVASSSDDMV